MPRCRPKYAHNPIKNAEINNRLNPMNSAPILSAIRIEYKIAVATPAHSSNFGGSYFGLTLRVCKDG